LFHAWLAHAYTATGAVLAFLAATEVFEGNYRAAFFWLGAQIVVDATDGVLARSAKVSTRLPWFNGAKLDDIIDYLCYVFVPALIVWRALLVPEFWAVPVAAAMLLSSAYGFNRDDAKTEDHFFTGFPSYWNIVVAYLFIAEWAPTINALILVGLAVLVFVPIRYLYPSRTPVWPLAINVLGALWGAAMVAMLWLYPDVPRALFGGSLVYPVFYVVLSLVVHFRRQTPGSETGPDSVSANVD
jgi:phosphatidylcholine synthase